jgi:hypothetical protein
MPFSELGRRRALLGTEVSEANIASMFGLKRTGQLGTTLAVTSNGTTFRPQLIVTVVVVSFWLILFKLKMEAIRSSETSCPTKATRRDILKEVIPFSPILSVFFQDVVLDIQNGSDRQTDIPSPHMYGLGIYVYIHIQKCTLRVVFVITPTGSFLNIVDM